jgi:hypothetical protein
LCLILMPLRSCYVYGNEEAGDLVAAGGQLQLIGDANVPRCKLCAHGHACVFAYLTGYPRSPGLGVTKVPIDTLY